MKSIWNEKEIQKWVDQHNKNCEVSSIERRNNSILYVHLKCNICGYKFCMAWESIKRDRCLCRICRGKLAKCFDFAEHEKYLHLTFPNYKLLDIKKKENSKIYYKVECENGHVYWGYRNHLHMGHGCRYCNHKGVKFWDKEKILELYKKFNLCIINLDEYTNSESVIYAKNKEGYIIKTVPSTLNRIGLQKSYLYNQCNKYAKYNIKHWCEINRPDYELINFVPKGKRSKCIFKYNGAFIKDGIDRCFECTLEGFIISGVNHPFITSSQGEREILLFLEDKGIKYLTQYKFDDCRMINPLRFDFYLPDYNICIEYNGKQHYQSIQYFGGDKNFQKQQQRDGIKRKYCRRNNIKLIEIAYNDDFNISMNNLLKVVNDNDYIGTNS